MMYEIPTAANRSFEEIAIGDEFAITRAFSIEDTLKFAAVSGDFSPLHVDDAYGASTEFGGCVLHGMLLASLFSQLVGMQIPGREALYLGQELTFRRPVRAGETVTARCKVIAKSEPTRVIVLRTEILGADGQVAVSGSGRVKVRGPSVAAKQHVVHKLPSDTAAKVAVVTGASRGIGAAIARELARQRYSVVVNFNNRADLAEAVVEDICSAGGAALAIQANVRDPVAVKALFAQVVEWAGAPSVLVNGAIGELDQRSFHDLSWVDFLTQLEYQVKAVVQTVQAVAPLMKSLGGGSIVNVLSQVTGNVPPTGMADYVTAKFALEGLSKALAAELAADAIRVNMISPGLVQTDLTQHYPDRTFKMEALRTPLRRLAQPADVARAVAFLAGDDGSFITGVNLFLTGGQNMP